METQNINLNVDAQTLAQCLKTVSDFGGTQYLNLCTGANNYVPWGSVDWFFAIILSTIGALFCLFLVGMIFTVISDF